ncbi:MAG: serine/threonine-protein phosphatase, partial [Blastocatellia bacterium]|nr:serine/threonine-protein phosphatase [Blastocatellia bacterium]
LVSDGSGGDGRGEIASSLAVHLFQQELFKTDSNKGAGDCLIEAAFATHQAIIAQANRDSQTAGMAATLTAALVIPPQVYVLEIGDSRCYLIRNQDIRQITKDQSMVQVLVDSGMLDAKLANTHPYRNVVLQSLGSNNQLSPVVTSTQLSKGDHLLLCSDGLSKFLPDQEIVQTLYSSPDLKSACKKLIERAKEFKSDDNITVVLAEVKGEAFSDPEPICLLSQLLTSSESDNDILDVTDILAPDEEKFATDEIEIEEG